MLSILKSLPPWAWGLIGFLCFSFIVRHIYFRTRKFDDCFDLLEKPSSSEDDNESRFIALCIPKIKIFSNAVSQAERLGYRLAKPAELDLFKERFRGIALWGAYADSDIENLYPSLIDGRIVECQKPYKIKPGDLFVLVRVKEKRSPVKAEAKSMIPQKV